MWLKSIVNKNYMMLDEYHTWSGFSPSSGTRLSVSRPPAPADAILKCLQFLYYFFDVNNFARTTLDTSFVYHFEVDYYKINTILIYFFFLQVINKTL